MPTTSTEISRSKILHPDQNHDGGAALHAKIATLLTTLGDNANSRYTEHTAIANNNFVTIDHNFGANLAELSVLIYSGTGATKQLILDTATAGYAIAEEAGLEETQVRVTAPGSGGPHTFTVLVTDGQLKPSELHQLLTSTPGNAASGTIRKWLDANGRGLTKTSTGVVGTRQTLTPIHTSSPAVTALPGFHYIIDSSSNVVIVTMPATIADYDRIKISDGTKSFNTNKCTIARNGNNIDGTAADYDLNFPGDWIDFTGDNTNSNWIADIPTAGASTGGESGINYMTNGLFENDATTGVSNDAGGTPVQFDEEIVSPLFGVRSSELTSQAGTGYVDYAISGIDPAVIELGIANLVTGYLKTDSAVAEGDWTCGVYSTTDSVYVTEQVDLAVDVINVFERTFVPFTGKTYVLRAEFTDTTAGRILIVDQLSMTPGLTASNGVIVKGQETTTLAIGDFSNATGLTLVNGFLTLQRLGSSVSVSLSAEFSGTGTDGGDFYLVVPDYKNETLIFDTSSNYYGAGLAQKSPINTDQTLGGSFQAQTNDNKLVVSRIGVKLSGSNMGNAAGRISKVSISAMVPVSQWSNEGVTLGIQDLTERTTAVDNSVLDIVTASSALNNPPTVIDVAEAIAYKDTNSTYRLRFNVHYQLSSASDTSFAFAGTSLPLTGAAAVTATDVLETVSPLYASTGGGINQVRCKMSGSTTQLAVSGDVRLASKPTWFDANRENPVSAAVHIDEATSTRSGVIKKTPAQIKTLGSDVSNSDSDILQFNNLTVGRRYTYKAMLRYVLNTAGVFYNFNIYSGATLLHEHLLRVAISTDFRNTYVINTEFTAVGTTAFIRLAGFAANSGNIQASGNSFAKLSDVTDTEQVVTTWT